MQFEFETIIVTSGIQERRGAVEFFCLNNGSYYTSHANGYIRVTKINKNNQRINYALNKRNKTTGKLILISDEKARMETLYNIAERHAIKAFKEDLN